MAYSVWPQPLWPHKCPMAQTLPWQHLLTLCWGLGLLSADLCVHRLQAKQSCMNSGGTPSIYGEHMPLTWGRSRRTSRAWSRENSTVRQQWSPEMMLWCPRWTSLTRPPHSSKGKAWLNHACLWIKVKLPLHCFCGERRTKCTYINLTASSIHLSAACQRLSTPHSEVPEIISEIIITEVTESPLHAWKDATICFLCFHLTYLCQSPTLVRHFVPCRKVLPGRHLRDNNFIFFFFFPAWHTSLAHLGVRSRCGAAPAIRKCSEGPCHQQRVVCPLHRASRRPAG